MEYEAVIGLEIHIQLATKTKLFCNCRNEYGAEPNTNVCPVCLGLPGALPVLNREAVKLALMAAMALDAKIHRKSFFYRKNYFYPDLPKGYQITQYVGSIATDAKLTFEIDGVERTVRIERMNVEEEAAKSFHAPDGTVLLDFNRSGIPLLEIVTMPDMRSPAEARRFLEILKRTIRYIGISACDMEKGELRVDSNVSVRPKGTEELGVKVELKNLNSFKAVEDGLKFEIQRQIKILESGGRVVQETRLWDEHKKETRTMRVKEEAHDYRYFPEPDLLPLLIDDELIESARKGMVELPEARRKRFITQYKLNPPLADVMVHERTFADYFEELAGLVTDKSLAANWLAVEVMKVLNEQGISIEEFPLRPKQIAELLKFVETKKITHNIAKKVFQKMLDGEGSAKEIIEREGLITMSDESELAKLVDEALSANPEIVEKYRKGKVGVIGVLVGYIMRKTRGRANAALVRKMLEEKLKA